MKLDTVLIKVASRCNINCSYCYVYNLGDTSWKGMPAQISLETITAVSDRLLALSNADNHPFATVLHGGEPLLLAEEDKMMQKSERQVERIVALNEAAAITVLLASSKIPFNVFCAPAFVEFLIVGSTNATNAEKALSKAKSFTSVSPIMQSENALRIVLEWDD